MGQLPGPMPSLMPRASARGASPRGRAPNSFGLSAKPTDPLGSDERLVVAQQKRLDHLPERAVERAFGHLGQGPAQVVLRLQGARLLGHRAAEVADRFRRAARLQQLAKPGEICISEATQRLVQTYVESEMLGERRVKGREEAIVVYRVTTARARLRPGRGESRPIVSALVGREKEIAAFSGRLERLAAGEGGIVGVLGEAGIGKSRLVAEASVEVIRNMSLLLRPSMLDDFGLVPALEWQAREVSKRTGLRVQVAADAK